MKYLREDGKWFNPGVSTGVIRPIDTKGWTRMAVMDHGTVNTCVGSTFSISKGWNVERPEIHEFKIMKTSYGVHLKSICDKTDDALSFTKVRVGVKTSGDIFLDVYFNKEKPEELRIFVSCNSSGGGSNLVWQIASSPQYVAETTTEETVLATLDFTSDYWVGDCLPLTGGKITGSLDISGDGSNIKIIDSATISGNARGMYFYDKDGVIVNGIGCMFQNGVAQYLYMGIDNDPWNLSKNLSVSSDAIRWKNKKLVTEDDVAYSNNIAVTPVINNNNSGVVISSLSSSDYKLRYSKIGDIVFINIKGGKRLSSIYNTSMDTEVTVTADLPMSLGSFSVISDCSSTVLKNVTASILSGKTLSVVYTQPTSTNQYEPDSLYFIDVWMACCIG